MKTKFSGMLTLLLAFVVQITFAQEKTISGTVSDDSGLPLPGTTVLIKGTSTGASTNFDGNYSIMANQGDVLVFSFVGYTTQEISIGSSSTINTTMVEDASVLEEVVITALGIKREARSLGYGTDILKSEDLIVARESNIVNSLQGKITGVQVSNTSGNLGSSSKIVIRGISSLSGRNSPLWIVDGVMINDRNTVSNGTRISGTRDFSNGAAVINPDDVESINVLKGAAATALYGSRAAAGVILVTTKRGKTNKNGGATVSINSTVRFDNIFRTPDYQQEYAMGSNGKYNSGSVGFDWGPRIAGQTIENLPVTGQSGPLTAVKDNGINDFFNTGYSYINNFSIADGNEERDYRLSLTSLNQTGILPGSELDRITIGFNTGVKHSEKLSSRFSFQYAKTKSEGTGAAGANDPNIIGLSSFSSTLDQNLFKPWKDASGNQANHLVSNDGVLANNPLWLRHENASDRDDDRFFGNFEITYKPIEKLSLTGRIGLDFEDDKRLIENSKTTISRLNGDFISDNIRRNEITADLIASFSTDLNSDLSLDALGGFQYNSRLFERQRIQGVDLLIPELFSPANAAQTIADRDFSESRLVGLYSSLAFDYKRWATLTFTARNDWSSTLPKDNNSYFYPSASLAFVFTDAFNIKKDWISFGKLRASWAQVGNDTNPYNLDFNFRPESTADGQYSLDLNFPFNGRLGYSASTVIPAANLLPEEQTSYEVGLELKLFNGRVSLDAGYFKSENRNQILNLPIPESTGFAFRTQNVGQVDQKGFEIALDITPIQTDNFSWDTSFNFSRAESKVVELSDGLERTQIASAFSSVSVVATVGEPLQLFGIDYLRDEASGRPIIDPETGRRQPGETTTLGNVLPDWTGGWVNTITYKAFTFRATFDVRWGGVMKSSTVENLQTGGLVKETLFNREGTFIDTEGILVDSNTGAVTENNVPLLNAQDFWTSLDDGSVATPFVFDASYVKFREVAITYTLPSKFLEGTFLNSASFGIEGRNLALLYSKVPHIDPESNLFGSGSDGFGIERASTPSTRSIGFNVRLTF